MGELKEGLRRLVPGGSISEALYTIGGTSQLAITLVCGTNAMRIKLNIDSPEDSSRVTSALCVLGIGIGLGSVMLYKLCSKIVCISKRKSSDVLDSNCSTMPAHLSPQSDSGISTGSNTLSLSHSIPYDKINGDNIDHSKLHFADFDPCSSRMTRSNNVPVQCLRTGTERPTSIDVAYSLEDDWSSLLTTDELCKGMELNHSTEYTDNRQFRATSHDSAFDELESIWASQQFQSTPFLCTPSEALTPMSDASGHSLLASSTNLSGHCSSWKRSYSDNSWDTLTSDVELFKTIECETEQNMSFLSQEIHDVESDIGDIASRIHALCSNASKVDVATNILQSLPSHKGVSLLGGSSTSSTDLLSSVDESLRQSPDSSMAWDYRGDVGGNNGSSFVADRPVPRPDSPLDMSVLSMSEPPVFEAGASSHTCSDVSSLPTSEISSTGGSPIHAQHTIGPDLTLEAYICLKCTEENEKATIVKEACHELVRRHGFITLNCLQNDKYSALRASICQTLTLQHPDIIHYFTNPELGQTINVFSEDRHRYLQDWQFDSFCSSESVHEHLTECLLSLQCLVAEISVSPQPQTNLALRWNKCPQSCYKAMEAVKALMMSRAIDLYESAAKGKDVPLFVRLMSSRNTSQSPRSLFYNHLNKIGHEAGVEQIEMQLLAEVLGVQIRCFRLLSFQNFDFISHFPEVGEGRPLINLLTEDDGTFSTII